LLCAPTLKLWRKRPTARAKAITGASARGFGSRRRWSKQLREGDACRHSNQRSSGLSICASSFYYFFSVTNYCLEISITTGTLVMSMIFSFALGADIKKISGFCKNPDAFFVGSGRGIFYVKYCTSHLRLFRFCLA